MPASDPAPFGVYVHVPFCAARCDYCAFATWTDRHHLTEPYLEACKRELAGHVEAGMPSATSIFFGGGTPSMVPAADLVRLLADIPQHRGCEVTVECNPDTITPELVHTYRAGGVNRVSLGVQSMAAHVLAALGRTHDRGQRQARGRDGQGGRLRHLQPRPHLWRRGRVARRLASYAR